MQDDPQNGRDQSPTIIDGPTVPQTQHVHDLWVAEAVDGFLPRSRVTMQNLGEIRPNIYIHEYHPDRDDWRVRLWGLGAVHLTDIDLQGQWSSALPAEVQSKYRPLFSRALEARRPVTAHNRAAEYNMPLKVFEIVFVPMIFEASGLTGTLGAFWPIA